MNYCSIPKLIRFSLFLLICISEMYANGTEKYESRSEQMGKAYSYYLLKKCDSSVVYYSRAWAADSQNLQAGMGLINSLMCLKKYRRALQVALSALKWNSDNFELNSTIAQIYALQNNVPAVNRVFSNLWQNRKKRNLPGYYMEDFLMSLGNASKEAGNYELAEHWFRMGDSLFSNNEFSDAILLLNVAKKERVKQNVNLISGILNYSGDQWISRGIYNGITTGLLIRNSFDLKASYFNLYLECKPQVIALTDSAGPQKETKEKNDRVNISDSLQEIPNLVQHDIHFSFSSRLNRTSFETGFRISKSDINYSEYANTVFAGHWTDFALFNIGAYWYYTHIPGISLMQLSPVAGIGLKFNKSSIKLNVMPGITRTFSNGEENNVIPEKQFTTDLSFGVHVPHLTVTLSGKAGDRSFYNEYQAVVINNVTENFRFGTKVLIEINPFSVPLVYYYLFRYDNYDNHSTNSHLGGIFFQW